MYGLVIVFAMFFASVSRKTIKHNPNYISNMNILAEETTINNFFLRISFIILIIPVCFRNYGIDHAGYLMWYNKIASYGINYFKVYDGNPEPMFALLNFIVANLFGDFQFVYIISGIICAVFIYKALFEKSKQMNVIMCLWMFIVSFYFNFYGLVRISIAVSIMTYAYKYIEEKRFRKFLMLCIVAAMFHYSAIIMIAVYFLSVRKKEITTNGIKQFIFLVFMAIIVPLGIYFASGLFIALFSKFSWFGRYAGYFKTNIQLSALKSSFWIYPLILIILLWGKQLKKVMNNYALYLRMFCIVLCLVGVSVFYRFERFTYYFYPTCIYLYSSVIKLPFHKNEKKAFILLYWITVLIFGILWIYILYFGNSILKSYLVPSGFNFTKYSLI